jgi:hypothetical protein
MSAPRASGITIAREYEPNLRRQVQLLVRLLDPRHRAAAPRGTDMPSPE